MRQNKERVRHSMRGSWQLERQEDTGSQYFSPGIARSPLPGPGSKHRCPPCRARRPRLGCAVPLSPGDRGRRRPSVLERGCPRSRPSTVLILSHRRALCTPRRNHTRACVPQRTSALLCRSHLCRHSQPQSEGRAQSAVQILWSMLWLPVPSAVRHPVRRTCVHLDSRCSPMKSSSRLSVTSSSRHIRTF